MSQREAAAIVGAASAAEVGAFLAMDSALMSLAAFGSVLGLGVLHLRTRKARRPRPPSPAPAPSPAAPLPSSSPSTESIPMPSPRPVPPPADLAPAASTPEAATEAILWDDVRWQESQAALAELSRKLDALAASETGAQANAALTDAIERAKRQTSALVAEVHARLQEDADASAQRATELADTCRAIEARVAKAEERLAAQAKRLEQTLVENAERAGDRGKEGIARLVRELSALREDVTRSSLTLAEMSAQTRASAWSEEQARAVGAASEQASALARRVGQLSERLDGGIGRLATTVDDRARDAKRQLDELAESASALLQVAERGAATAEEAARAAAGAEVRLAQKLDQLRADVAAITLDVDLEPVLAAVERAEDGLSREVARVLHEVERLAAREMPPMQAPDVHVDVDLAPTLRAVEAAEERLARRFAGVEGAVDRLAARPERPSPPPVDVDGPVRALGSALDQRLDALRREVHTLADREVNVAAPDVHVDVDLAPILHAVSEAESHLAREIAMLPREPRVDWSPIVEAVARTERATAKLRDDVLRLAQREPPAPTPVAAPEPIILTERVVELAPIDWTPLHDALARTERTLSSSLSTLPDATGAVVAAQESLTRELRKLRDDVHRLATREVPVPPPTVVDVAAPLAVWGERLGEQMRELHDAIDAVETYPGLERQVAKLRKDLEALPAALPAAEPTDLTPVLDALHDMELELRAEMNAQLRAAMPDVDTPIAELDARMTEQLRALRGDLKPLRDELHKVEGRLRKELERVAAREPAPAPAPLVPDARPAIASLREEMHRWIAALQTDLVRLAAEEPAPALPAAAAPDLRPALAQLRDDLHGRLHALHGAVERVASNASREPASAPDARPALDALHASLREEMRALHERLTTLPSTLPVATAAPDLRPALSALRADVLARFAAMEAQVARVAEREWPAAPDARPAVESLRAELQEVAAGVETLLARKAPELPRFPEIPPFPHVPDARPAVESLRADVAALASDVATLLAREPPAPVALPQPPAPAAPIVFPSIPDARPAIAGLRADVVDRLAALQAQVEEVAAREWPAWPTIPDARPAVEQVGLALQELHAEVALLAARETRETPDVRPHLESLRAEVRALAGEVAAIEIPAPAALPPIPDARPALEAVARAVGQVQGDLARLSARELPAAPDARPAVEHLGHAITQLRAEVALLAAREPLAAPDARPLIESLRADLRALAAQVEAIEIPPFPAIPEFPAFPPVPDARPAVEQLGHAVAQLRADVALLAAREPPAAPDARPLVESLRADLRADLRALAAQVESIEIPALPAFPPIPDARPAVEHLGHALGELRADVALLAAREPPATPDARPSVEALRHELRGELGAIGERMATLVPDLEPIHATLTQLHDEISAFEVEVPAPIDARPAVEALRGEMGDQLTRLAGDLRAQMDAVRADVERFAAREVPAPVATVDMAPFERVTADVAALRDDLQSLALQEPDWSPSFEALERNVSQRIDTLMARSLDDAQVIHATVEDVLNEMEVRHRKMESAIEKLGREMDARVAGLEARLLDEVRAIAAQVVAANAPPAPPQAAPTEETARPRRQLRRATE